MASAAAHLPSLSSVFTSSSIHQSLRNPNPHSLSQFRKRVRRISVMAVKVDEAGLQRPTTTKLVFFLGKGGSKKTTSSILAAQDYKGADNNEELKYKSKRPKKLGLSETKPRCRSSSHSLHKLLSRQLMREHGAMSTTLRKTSSCKGLHEQLEYEELKGFMDLGFRFNKEQLCPRMMSVLPGLQRLDDYNDLIEQDTSLQQASKENGEFDHHEFMEDKKKYVITRPYLSEAWLIKSPNSPLLNLRMPPVSDPNDMKKHLKSWARTVATVVQVEL